MSQLSQHHMFKDHRTNSQAAGGQPPVTPPSHPRQMRGCRSTTNRSGYDECRSKNDKPSHSEQ
eukprot:3203341-Amphidinium_carterae.1